MKQLSMAHLAGLLFLACLGSSRAQTRVEVVQVVAGARLQLQCVVGAGAAAAWRRGDEALSAARLQALGLAAGERVEPRGAGVLLTLSAAHAAPQHAGRYSCGGAQPPIDLVVLSAAAARGEAATEREAAGDEAGRVSYEVGQLHLELTCDLPGLAPDATILWSKNGTALGEAGAEGGEAARWAAEGARLRRVGRAHEDDYGNYTCSLAGKGGESRTIEVTARTIAKLNANTNVVEGQKLKLTCKLSGRPYQPVTWLFANASAPENDNGTDAVSALTALGVVPKLQVSEQGAEDGELLVEAASKALAGRYMCYSGEGNRNSSTTLRVKDMYAALWPFLGIVLEVVILCSVIAVYERRRTKPDLADSDTDTPNQKKS